MAAPEDVRDRLALLAHNIGRFVLMLLFLALLVYISLALLGYL